MSSSAYCPTETTALRVGGSGQGSPSSSTPPTADVKILFIVVEQKFTTFDEARRQARHAWLRLLHSSFTKPSCAELTQFRTNLATTRFSLKTFRNYMDLIRSFEDFQGFRDESSFEFIWSTVLMNLALYVFEFDLPEFDTSIPPSRLWMLYAFVSEAIQMLDLKLALDHAQRPSKSVCQSEEQQRFLIVRVINFLNRKYNIARVSGRDAQIESRLFDQSEEHFRNEVEIVKKTNEQSLENARRLDLEQRKLRRDKKRHQLGTQIRAHCSTTADEVSRRLSSISLQAASERHLPIYTSAEQDIEDDNNQEASVACSTADCTADDQCATLTDVFPQ